MIGSETDDDSVWFWRVDTWRYSWWWCHGVIRPVIGQCIYKHWPYLWSPPERCPPAAAVVCVVSAPTNSWLHWRRWRSLVPDAQKNPEEQEHQRTQPNTDSLFVHTSVLDHTPPAGQSWDAAVAHINSSYSPLLCWSQTSQLQRPDVTWQQQQQQNQKHSRVKMSLDQNRKWTTETVVSSCDPHPHPHLLRASWAPATAVSSTCRVPLRSMSTAFTARLPAMMHNTSQRLRSSWSLWLVWCGLLEQRRQSVKTIVKPLTVTGHLTSLIRLHTDLIQTGTTSQDYSFKNTDVRILFHH